MTTVFKKFLDLALARGQLPVGEDLDHGDLDRGSHVANILPHLGEHDVGALPPHGLKVGFMAEFVDGLFANLAILGGLGVHIGEQGRSASPPSVVALGWRSIGVPEVGLYPAGTYENRNC